MSGNFYLRKIMVWVMSLLIVPIIIGMSSYGFAKQLRIGFVVKATANPYWLEAKAGGERAAKELGVQLVFLSPEREQDIAVQVSMVEDLVQQKVDGIVVAPADSWAIVTAIETANRAGIPVVCIDTLAFGGEVVTTPLTDNVKGAEIAAEYIAKRLNGKGKVAILTGILAMQTGRDRLNGFANKIKPYPGIAVVTVQPAGWERAQGFTVTENIMTAHPDLDAIFASNDQMALGALEAISAAGKLGKIVLIGFDGVKEALEQVKAGRLDATIKQFPDKMGYLGVKKVVEAIQGKKVPKIIDTGVDLVTSENVDKYLE